MATQIPNPLLGEVDYEDDDGAVSDDAEIGPGRPGGRRAAADDGGGGGGCCCFGGKKGMTPLEMRAENDRRRTRGMPLLDEEEGLTAKEAKERRKEVRAGGGGGGGGRDRGGGARVHAARCTRSRGDRLERERGREGIVCG